MRISLIASRGAVAGRFSFVVSSDASGGGAGFFSRATRTARFSNPASLRMIWISGSSRMNFSMRRRPNTSGSQRSCMRSFFACTIGVAAKRASSAIFKSVAAMPGPPQKLTLSSLNVTARPIARSMSCWMRVRFFRTMASREKSRTARRMTTATAKSAMILRLMPQEQPLNAESSYATRSTTADSLADADAHRRDAVAAAAPLHLVEQRRHNARAAAAERVAERDRAAVDVDTAHIEVQLADIVQRLRGERLVDLEEIDVFDFEPGALERL